MGFLQWTSEILSLISMTKNICVVVEFIDATEHASRLFNEDGIRISIIAPRPIESLKLLYFPKDVMMSPPSTKSEHLVLLNGYTLPAIPTAVPVKEVPTRPKIWEGEVKWNNNRLSTSDKPYAYMIAYPYNNSNNANNVIDLVSARDWPPVLSITGVCGLKDPQVSTHVKTATVIEFVIDRKRRPQSGKEPPVTTLFEKLKQQSWGAVIHLANINKTLLIIPNKDKYMGAVIHKMILNTPGGSSTVTTTGPPPMAAPKIAAFPYSSSSTVPMPITTPVNTGGATTPGYSAVTTNYTSHPPPVNPTGTIPRIPIPAVVKLGDYKRAPTSNVIMPLATLPKK